MAYTITYLGSQVETTTDKEIVVANCVTGDNDSLVVFAGAYDAGGSPTVTYGGVTIGEDDWRIAPTSRIAGGIWFKNTVWSGRTADVTVTFGAVNTRRWCVVYSISNGGRKDVVKRNVQEDGTVTSPSTLLSATLETYNELVMGYHLSNGPITDTAPTMDTDLTGLHRIGTSSGTNDITIQTTMKEVEYKDPVKSKIIGTVARSWLSALIVVKPIVEYPALDSEGNELLLGDTVLYEGTSSTITAIYKESGLPVVTITLANGIQTASYFLTLVE